jgi:hypothetical protein
VYDPSYKNLLRSPKIGQSVRSIVQKPAPEPENRSKCTIDRTKTCSGAGKLVKVYDPSYKNLLRSPKIGRSVRSIVQKPAPEPENRSKCTIHRTKSCSGARKSVKVYDLSYKNLLRSPKIGQSVRSIVQNPAPEPENRSKCTIYRTKSCSGARKSVKVYDPSYKNLLRGPKIGQSVRSIVQKPAPEPENRSKCTIYRTKTCSGARKSVEVYDSSYKNLLQAPKIGRSVRSIVQKPAPEPENRSKCTVNRIDHGKHHGGGPALPPEW